MDAEDLYGNFPRLFHMAEDGSWPSIQRHGLLSTSALLDLFEIQEKERFSIESERRAERVTVTHPDHGTAIIRDQKPLNMAALDRILIGMSPQQWFETLNARVFFWLTEKRLIDFLSARSYRDQVHSVIAVDTRALLERHAARVALTSFNTGSTYYNPPRRGVGTFLSIPEYPFDERRRKRGLAHAVVELAVERGVSDIGDVAVSVTSWKADNRLSTIWRR
jgi:hypothetical protein